MALVYLLEMSAGLGELIAAREGGGIRTMKVLGFNAVEVERTGWLLI